MGTTSPRTQSRVDVPQPLLRSRRRRRRQWPVIVGVNAAFVPEGYLAGADAVASQRDAHRPRARRRDDARGRRRRHRRVQLRNPSRTSPPGSTAPRWRRWRRCPASSASPRTSSTEPHSGVERSARQRAAGVGCRTHRRRMGGGRHRHRHREDAQLPDRQGRRRKPATSNAGGGGVGSTTRAPAAPLASTAIGSGVPCARRRGCDHGTHVAGIAAGVNAPGGVNGVAPGASLVRAAGVHPRSTTRRLCAATPTPCTSALTSRTRCWRSTGSRRSPERATSTDRRRST